MVTGFAQFWALLLIVAAAVSLAFAVRRIVRGEQRGLGAAGAVVFRLGLIVVGLVYATGLVYRSRTAVLAGFGIAAAGALLNLIGGLAAGRHSTDDADTASPGSLDDE
jgi:protein-S-isoprenylcysteine O-methyltransferase Ste14